MKPQNVQMSVKRRINGGFIYQKNLLVFRLTRLYDVVITTGNSDELDERT